MISTKQLEKDRFKMMQGLGKKKYIFKYGFLYFGMSLTIVYLFMTVVYKLLANDSFNLTEYIFSMEFLFKSLSTIIMFGLAGWFYGRTTWKSYQKRFDDNINLN